MTFHVGQKVVCVDATQNLGTKEISKGAIYTVAAIDTDPEHPCYGISNPEQGVFLVGVRRPNCPFCRLEFSFNSLRFRPVHHQETDISELQKLCDPTREVVR